MQKPSVSEVPFENNLVSLEEQGNQITHDRQIRKEQVPADLIQYDFENKFWTW